MATAAVTVVVVNYNGGEMVLRCLAALRGQTFRRFLTIVVDNASTDGSAQRIAEAFPEVRLLHAGANLGFAGGNNLAFAHCTDEWVALLNPDAYPEADWLATLVAAADSLPGYAAFASTMVLADAPDMLDGVGDAYHASGLCWRLGHGLRRPPATSAIEEVFAPCAAAALYRRSALMAAGGFDEAFFCYCEDVDLGFRLRLAGHRCALVPAAVVGHASSGIVGRNSDFQIYQGHRNLVWAFVKNMPTALFWPLLPAHVCLNLVSLAWFAARGRGRTIWRAKCDALRGLPAMWRKRRLIQAERRASSLAVARSLRWGLRRR